MEANLPHEVIYDTPQPVPIADVIESLRGTMLIAQDIGPLLEVLIPGLSVTSLTVTVVGLSQESPLRELFTLGLAGVYQDKLSPEMPEIIHSLFGVTISPEYNNLVSLLFITLIFYSCSFISTAAGKVVERPKTQRLLDDLISEVSKMLGQDESVIRNALERRYRKSGATSLLSAALKFLAPSKNQDNASLVINTKSFPHALMAEFPSYAQVKDDEPGLTSYPLQNVEIQLHAQDVDRNKQGWAAVVPTLSLRRIPMSLVPPMQPSDIYTQEVVYGDVLVEAKRNDEGDTVPIRIHLLRLQDQK